MHLTESNRPEFIVDENVGKLAKALRLLGFDAIFFTGEHDSQMVNIALAENRIILTRDTHVIERRLITRGQVKAILIKSDDTRKQIQQVVIELGLLQLLKPFSICMEDNQPLIVRTKSEVEGRVPPYVFQTQQDYMECPRCHRIYWKGTHWQAMINRLMEITKLLKEDPI